MKLILARLNIKIETGKTVIIVATTDYPPLRFEPWPEDSDEESKVDLLYRTCREKSIPMITHCSTGGFLVENNYKAFSDPSNQWAKVLGKYSDLKINFAHFGSDDKAREKAIVKHILNGDNRLY